MCVFIIKLCVCVCWYFPGYFICVLYVCAEGGQSESDRVVWRIQLDQDLVDTLVGIYPEWFNVKPQPPSPNMATQSAATGAPPPPPPPPLSPPKAEVDESPLQKNKDKNKECKYRTFRYTLYFFLFNYSFNGLNLFVHDFFKFFRFVRVW